MNRDPEDRARDGGFASRLAAHRSAPRAGSETPAPAHFDVPGASRLRVAIAGGGTGGHVFPAVALAETLAGPGFGAEVLYLCSTRGTEFCVRSRPWARTLLFDAPRPEGLMRLPGFGARIGAAVLRLARELERFSPCAVVGTGGYASVAPALAARLLGLPLILLEQNAIPGRANRLLSRIAREVHVQFAESRDWFPDSARVFVSGNPVRSSVLAAARARERPRRGFTLLVMGGSQGARRINEALAGALGRLGAAMRDIRILHCAGLKDEESARERLFASGLAGRVWGFCEQVEDLYAQADLAVSRAGATAIAELEVCALPAILVPYPHASDGHQEANARSLLRAGACEVISDAELDGRTLAERVLALARDEERRAEMSSRMGSLARPLAAETIARAVARCAGLALAARRAA